MKAIDINLFVGDCPFRSLPSSVEDLERLREAAGLERAIATSFNALFYYDAAAGLERDLGRYGALGDWLFFYAIINPDFPDLERQVESAARDRRIVGLRLFPGLHGCALDSPGLSSTVLLAAEHDLPVNLAARLIDERVAPRYLNQGHVHPQGLADLLRQSSQATMVLSMFFFDELESLDIDWGDLPRTYLDLGCSKPKVDSFDRLTSWFPAERVMFGTGAPLYYWKGSRLAVEGSTLPAKQQEAILGGNASEVFPWA